jgi:D-alanyl-D-alanine carboxypeptidase
LLGTQTNAKTGTLPDTYPFYFHASNDAGVLSFPSTRSLSFAAIHEHLTAGEASDLYDAVQALRTSFGGGYV